MSAALTFDIDLVASASGRDYRIHLWVPPGPVPEAGWPALWVLDGAGYQGLAVDMVRNRGTLGFEIAPAVVAAVGYPTDDMDVWMTRRFLDFSSVAPAAEAGLSGVPCGGLDGFLDMLAQDAAPAVAAHAPIDHSRMAIIGHSMGGLAVLHALFKRPALFQSYVAISPSIHWADGEVLHHEAAFNAQVQAGTVAPRVFIAVGALEQDLPPAAQRLAPELRAQALQRIRASRAVDNAAELAARLQALGGAPGYEVRYACSAGETHMSVPFAVYREALDLALPLSAPFS